MSFQCRSCAGTRFAPVIDLGETPLANALIEAEALDKPEARYPLRVVFCRDCSLVQITKTVPPKILFSKYVYISSFSDTTVASAKAIAQRLTRERNLGESSLVMEAASNDGYLLQHYRDLGVPVLGIEPAANIAEIAERNGVRTRCAFFGREEGERLASKGLRCDVFHANNVLAHVADLNGFVAGVKMVLKPDGLASMEVPYLGELVDKLEFDTIYHEHLCYFSATALDRLFARHALLLSDVERLPIHGGSLRLFVTHADGQRSRRLKELLDEEMRLGLTRSAAYADFEARVLQLRKQLVALLNEFKAGGKKLGAYGASAKGATLLNFFEIGRDLLDFVVDRSTVKQHKFTPGTHLPILPPEALLARKPDYVLLLTWNFADEILAQQADYRKMGGKFILPVPDVRVV
ncbi:MAG: methyltransferase domain-containing protein [Steroidobacteraceae bacterium]